MDLSSLESSFSSTILLFSPSRSHLLLNSFCNMINSKGLPLVSSQSGVEYHAQEKQLKYLLPLSPLKCFNFRQRLVNSKENLSSSLSGFWLGIPLQRHRSKTNLIIIKSIDVFLSPIPCIHIILSWPTK